MIDGESHGRPRRHVPGIGDLLVVGPDGHGEIEHQVIQDVHDARQDITAGVGIRQENQDEHDVFDAEEGPLAEAVDHAPDDGVGKVIDNVVDDEKRRDGLDGIIEPFHQKKNRKYDENLAPCSRKKGQGVIEPVPPLENHLFHLGMQVLPGRVLHQPPASAQGNEEPQNAEHLGEIHELGHEINEGSDGYAGRRRGGAKLSHDQG